MTCCSIEALAFAQDAQRQAMTTLRDAYAEHGFDSPLYWRTVMVYDASVATLVGILGPSAPCAAVDPLTFETFCDVFKSRNGFKPRGFCWSLGEVEAWLNSQRDLPFEEDDVPSEAEMLAEEAAERAAVQARRAEIQPEPWQIAAGRVPGMREEWLTGY